MLGATMYMLFVERARAALDLEDLVAGGRMRVRRA